MAHFLITGANRGIGLELCRQIASRGHRVIATCREPAAAKELAAIPNIEIFPLEVTDAASVAALARALEGRPIDALVNNAGIIGPVNQSTLDMDFDGFAQTLAVNTLAPLRMTQALLPNLKMTRGKLVTITSYMGSLAGSSTGRLAYRASKAAVNKLMRGVAGDLQSHGIAVLLLHPGWVRTDMGGSGADISPQDSAAGIIRQIDALNLAGTGAFLDYSGKPMPW